MIQHRIKKLFKVVMPFGIIAYYQSTKKKKEYLMKALKNQWCPAKGENISK